MGLNHELSLALAGVRILTDMDKPQLTVLSLLPLFGALLSHFIWDETLGFWGWLGALLVIFAGLLLLFVPRK
ncbi:hypothetical protein HX037_09385 [Ignatzschineria indica]|uniref:hypothetical protein n=1 Tax=Ignatzschineria indica TaxID=472583 RepID=UPI00257649B0|nr:hypothetical protein [Ignatzschineria indica]MDM1546085.1 hypothetical protein [Ignatzschineria indica]